MTEILKLLIDLKEVEPDLDPEELENLSFRLVNEIKDGLVEDAKLVRVTTAPSGTKSERGFDLGILQAEVSVENLLKLLNWLKERFFGSTLTLQYGDVTLTYRTEQELQMQLAALHQIQNLKIRVVKNKSGS